MRWATTLYRRTKDLYRSSILHTYTCYIVIIDSAVFGVENHTFPKHLLKMQTLLNTFLRISSPKNFLRCPKLESRFLALLPLTGGPGPPFVLASTAAPLLSKNSAAATLPKNAAAWSGVSPQAAFSGARRPLWPKPRETTNVVGS